VKRLNWKVLVLCSAAFILAGAVTWGVYGAMPHIEDEQANVFQAKVFAGGDLAVRQPPAQPHSFYLPFILDVSGWQFSKYPPGYSLLLTPGVWIDQLWLINAIAAALVVLAVYLLGRDLFNATTGLLAAALGVIAPMFVLLSGAFISHVPTMALLTLGAWGFVRSRGMRAARSTRVDPTARTHPIGFAVLTGITFGWAFITRPWTAIAICLPFVILAVLDLVQRPRAVWRVYGSMLLMFGGIALLLPLYNTAVSGAPFTNTYALWWSMDRLGFGPGIGPMPNGHSIYTAAVNFQLDFSELGPMLLGWPSVLGVSLAWLAVLAGLLWPPLDQRDWALIFPPLLLIAAHLLYWARGSSFYGPRYYAEAMPFLWIVAARGLIKVCAFKWPRRLVYVALPLLIAWNVVFTIEPRFLEGFTRYRIGRADVNAIAAAELQHALIFVRAEDWSDYAHLAWLNKPRPATGDLIFVYDFGPLGNARIMEAFPDRQVYYYDRTQPYPVVAGRTGE
jgi:4-amino-4-deoxy-L-arabinose transferase-like glycosyltransferase